LMYSLRYFKRRTNLQRNIYKHQRRVKNEAITQEELHKTAKEFVTKIR
jgi:hypothetical protein